MSASDNQTTGVYSPGLVLDLRILDTSNTLCVRIDSLFLPFTKSQAMRVTILSGPEDFAAPNRTILKLYDRRWIDDRGKRVWTPSREATAREAWNEKRWAGVQPFNLFDNQPSDDVQWEEYFRYLMKVCARLLSTPLRLESNLNASARV